VAIIVLGFSIFLYQSIGHNLNDANDDDFSGLDSRHHFVQNTLDSVQNDLMLADLFILITAAGLSFVLAGKTLKPIQLSVEAQKAFAANASHELRTPLAVMRNDIEVLLRNQSPTKEVSHKTMVSNLEEIGRMSHIVEDLLVLARSDSHIFPPHKEIDINFVLKNVIERVRPLAESKNIKLNYTSANTFVIKGNQTHLERAILNILQNSIDHTPANGTISLSLERNASQVVLNINDTGSGISANDLPHIFKRFYKGNSTTGTGLGLSIVKEIINQHKGHISIESSEGKGTSVIIHLPLV
jgi:signal transduction histidine kinase